MQYSNDLREPHGNAVKRIGCYLKSFLDEGIILKPDLDNLAINLQVDANFAKSWNLKDLHDTNGVKSRTGFFRLSLELNCFGNHLSSP